MVLLWLSAAGAAASVGQSGVPSDLHKPFDEILDVYVRDGYVYYRALKTERGKLDGIPRLARRVLRHRGLVARRPSHGVLAQCLQRASC